MIHVAAFSGGKDSTALLLWLREQDIAFTAVFCDTGWEHPLTYAYIEEINRTLLGGRLVTVRNARWFDPVETAAAWEAGVVPNGGMTSLVAKRGRVPSARARFCTEELKIFPMRDWLRTLDTEATVYQGIRAEESPQRAALPPRQWSDVYDCWVERPLFYWSASDVFAMLKRHGVEANPLYRLGAKRVGCFPCVMTRHAELLRLHSTLPEVWERIAELEAASGRSFFPPDYIPERFHTSRDPKSGLTYPSVEDVRRYLLGAGEEQLKMFGETPACLSVYNLCE